MKKYDYSGLLKSIGDMRTDREKAVNERLFSRKQQLLDLENKVVSSGMLEDWVGLKDVCRKAKVCLNPAENNYDNYKGNGVFGVYTISSYNYLSQDFGFILKDGNLVWKWENDKGRFESEEQEINIKIKVLNSFLDTYEEYRDFQLQRVFNAMGSMSDETAKIREEIK